MARTSLWRWGMFLAGAAGILGAPRGMSAASPAGAGIPVARRAVGDPPGGHSAFPEADPHALPRWSGAYGRLPLSFEANRGQADRRVQFVSRGSGCSFYLTSDEAVLCLNPAKRGPRVRNRAPWRLARSAAAAARPVVLRTKLLGARAGTRAVGLDELPGKSHYLIGNDPGKWHVNVPRYARVRYRNVYAGIDLVFHGRQRRLEYDLVAAPGANPKAIRLAFAGADGARLDRTGDLILHTAGGEVRMLRPDIYQQVGAGKRPIHGGYVLLSPPRGQHGQRGRACQVGFAVASYDARRPLVIDPVLSYATYLGGSGADAGTAIAVDSAGSAYVAGSTSSSPFPTASPLQPTFGGAGALGLGDAFVAKLNPTGTDLAYCTYLGGTDDDGAWGIAVDAAGDACVTGVTRSHNFPLAAALQPQPGGLGTVDYLGDAFVAKLNASGSGLIYSTYLGGSGGDEGLGIAMDASGSAYVTGLTLSADFPFSNPLQHDTGGGEDAFVAKLDPTGTMLLYSTYLGGAGDDSGSGIAVDDSGNAYVTGQTSSADFPAVNSEQATLAGGSGIDAFVAKLNASGSALLYSTYLGGTGDDIGFGIAVDGAGSAYVTGSTDSHNFPAVNAYRGTFSGPDFLFGDAFVTKLDPTGAGLVYSTYLGGTGFDAGFGIAVDSAGSAYVTGTTGSADFPTLYPLQAVFGGTEDAFVTKLTPSGAALAYSTFLGGSGFDRAGAHGIALDAFNNVYLTGVTSSRDFHTVNPKQKTFGDGPPDSPVDAFIAQLQTVQALWVFSDELTDPAVRKTLVDQSAASGVNTLYLSVYNGSGGTNGRLMYPDDAMADLIGQAHAKGIRVYAAYGNTDWPSLDAAPGAFPDSFPGQRIADVLSYNFAKPAAKFDGVIYDVEASTITNDTGTFVGFPGFSSTTTQAQMFQALLKLYQDTLTTPVYHGNQLQGSLSSNGLALAVAAQFFWQSPDVGTVEFPAGSNNVKEVYQHIVDMNLANVVVMGYRDTAAGITPLDQDEITYAASQNKPGLVLVGVETQSGQDNNITFYEEGQTVMNQELAKVVDHFGAQFGGFAIHRYRNSFLGGVKGWPDAKGVVQVTGANGTVTTDPQGVGPTAANPVETAVTTPNAGAVSVTEGGTTQTAPAGYQFLNQQITITAPPATAANPLVLQFRLDVSLILTGEDQNTIQVYRNGVAVPDSTGGPGIASPDPCVVSRERLSDGSVRITVLTSGASVWNFGAVDFLPVPIDIKPGSYPNSVNLGVNGVVPVAILSTPTFDARTVIPTSVTLASAPVKLKGNGTPQASIQDVNGDGLPDLVVQISTSSLQLSSTDTQAVLQGRTADGRLIRGTDTVRIVP